MLHKMTRLRQAGDTQAIRAMKPQIDRLSISTVCDKAELDIARHRRLNWVGAAWAYISSWWGGGGR
jgi:hypothetical protein